VIILLVSGAGPNYLVNRDYLNYKIRYDNISQAGLFYDPQIGFTLLMKLGNLLNLDFFIFRMIVIGICLILLYGLVIKRYSYNYNYVLLLYLLYPMIIDSEHFRNFIAMTILLIAIKFLEKRNFKNSLKFLMLIFISASFHTVFLAYVFLLLLNVKNRKLLIRMVVSATIVLTIITIINNNNIPFLDSLISILEYEKLVRYLSSKTNLGYLMPILLHVINIFLLFWSKRILLRKKDVPKSMTYIKSKELNKGYYDETSFVDLIMWINIVGIIFFPLFIMNLQFYRLIRNLLILNYIVYSIISYKLKPKSLYKFIYNFSIIISVGLWIVFDLIIKTIPERVLIPFFTQNYFF
jgi:hypothetical protein